MQEETLSSEDRFVGSLLGLAVGDALGANFEGQSAEYIRRRYMDARELVSQPPQGALWHTDDTQMAIGVAETLVSCGEIAENELCRRFAENYVPQRGYGRGARLILEAMVQGEDHRFWATNCFPGGSYGNGAAMRVAPIGLVFGHCLKSTLEQAERSALPTHTHPLGVQGAQLLALAVALASTVRDFNREEYFATPVSHCSSDEYHGPLGRAARLADVRDLPLFGNGIEATNSVVTAIASFGLTPDSFVAAVGNAILLGGDTDTIAAMAGAISGAYLGASAIPSNLLEQLEDRHQGRTYIVSLARSLYRVHERLVNETKTA